jgi:hypothetical protein
MGYAGLPPVPGTPFSYRPFDVHMDGELDGLSLHDQLAGIATYIARRTRCAETDAPEDPLQAPTKRLSCGRCAAPRPAKPLYVLRLDRQSLQS